MEFKREHPRVAVQLKIKLKRSQEEYAECDVVRNFCLGGAFVETKRVFHVNDVLDFTLYLEGGVALLKGKIRVVRCALEPIQGLGLQFLELTQSQKTKLKKIIDSTLQ